MLTFDRLRKLLSSLSLGLLKPTDIYGGLGHSAFNEMGCQNETDCWKSCLVRRYRYREVKSSTPSPAPPLHFTVSMQTMSLCLSSASYRQH